MDFIGTIEDEHTVRRDTLRGLARDWVLQFVTQEDGSEATNYVVGAFVDSLKDRIDKVKVHDSEIKTFAKKTKKKRRMKQADSDLSEFMA